MKRYLPNLLLLAGIYLTAYGLSAMRYSRWNHRQNALIRPVFHPWAIAAGLLIIGLAYLTRGGADKS